MRVKRIQMSSFRGIGDLTLDFHETEPTILIGINGVGKSSILDCLAILLSGFISRIKYNPKSRSVFVKMAKYNSFPASEKETDLAKGRSFKKEDITNEHHKTSCNLLISIPGTEDLALHLNKDRQGKSENTNNNNDKLDMVAKDIREQWKTSNEFNIPLAVYYPVNRAVFDIDLEIKDNSIYKQVDAYEQALDGVRISFDSFFKWFRLIEDLENEKMRDNHDYRNRQIEAVRQAIYSIITEFSNLRVRRSPLRMTVKKQDEELIVNQLSDGEKCLLAMVGDLARRLAIANPGLANPLEGSGVVMIDEIELHLHPKWQREIIPALKRTFPNCQFIITTHSPQIISQVKPDSIYILEKTNNGIIAMRPESSYGRDSNRILEDLMDTSERPQEIKERLQELFRVIARGDLEKAKQLQQEIAAEIGADEPELAGASVSIRRREILGR
ncbi:AAA family ATPase [Limnofasciculus baicalensis]|nr:AAA family ATPase [Limnofasciculus baicalensis]